jgi:hypothetical protein
MRILLLLSLKSKSIEFEFSNDLEKNAEWQLFKKFHELHYDRNGNVGRKRDLYYLNFETDALPEELMSLCYASFNILEFNLGNIDNFRTLNEIFDTIPDSVKEESYDVNVNSDVAETPNNGKDSKLDVDFDDTLDDGNNETLLHEDGNTGILHEDGNKGTLDEETTKLPIPIKNCNRIGIGNATKRDIWQKKLNEIASKSENVDDFLEELTKQVNLQCEEKAVHKKYFIDVMKAAIEIDQRGDADISWKKITEVFRSHNLQYTAYNTDYCSKAMGQFENKLGCIDYAKLSISAIRSSLGKNVDQEIFANFPKLKELLETISLSSNIYREEKYRMLLKEIGFNDDEVKPGSEAICVMLSAYERLTEYQNSNDEYFFFNKFPVERRVFIRSRFMIQLTEFSKKCNSEKSIKVSQFIMCAAKTLK